MELVHMSDHNGFQVVLVPAVNEITQYGDHCVHHPHHPQYAAFSWTVWWNYLTLHHIKIIVL